MMVTERRSVDFLLFYAERLTPHFPWELCREVIAYLVRLRQRRIDTWTLLARAGELGGVTCNLTRDELKRQSQSRYRVVFDNALALSKFLDESGVKCDTSAPDLLESTVVTRGDISLMIVFGSTQPTEACTNLTLRVENFRNPFEPMHVDTLRKDKRNLHVTEWRKGVGYRVRHFWEESRIDVCLDF